MLVNELRKLADEMDSDGTSYSERGMAFVSKDLWAFATELRILADKYQESKIFILRRNFHDRVGQDNED